MLKIYGLILEVVRDARGLVEAIGQKDPDLARQMKRALTSVPLNVAEGSSSRGRNRAARYHSGAGSMCEVIAAVQVAEALGYVASVDASLVGRMRLIENTLKKNARS